MPRKSKAVESTAISPEKQSESQKDKKRGWDEIESLFSNGKKKKKATAQAREEACKKVQQEKPARKSKPHPIMSAGREGEWVDDGLGGVYNAEGFTGRVEDGVKVFKAHILRKQGAGYSPDCPFDCKCCFI